MGAPSNIILNMCIAYFFSHHHNQALIHTMYLKKFKNEKKNLLLSQLCCNVDIV